MMDIFVNPSGQLDNIGDSVLRRYYLRQLRRSGRLIVLVRGTHDYRDGLGLTAEDVVFSSAARWLLAAFVAAIRGRCSFALNAGEIVVDRKYWITALWQVALSACVQIRGGKVIAVGISLRDNPGSAISGLRFILKRASVVRWRDPVGRTLTGVGGVCPDWAFTESHLSSHRDETLPERRRSILAVSMRGDRPYPPRQVLKAIRNEAKERGLSIVVVVQVVRDRARALSLAADLAGEVLDWEGGPHDTQEQAVRDLYSQAFCVVGDRLHALILGACEGARPIGLSVVSTTKLDRSFAAIGVPHLTITADEIIASPSAFAFCVEESSEIVSKALLAKRSLQAVCIEMEECLGS